MIDIEQLVKRQRILADFGELGLRSDDLNEVLTEACRLVGRALDTDLATVMEIEGEGENAVLFVRAGVGWPPEVIGKVHWPLRERSSEAHAIAEGAHIIMSDLGTENPADIPAYVTAAGVRGVIKLPIFLPGGKAFGLLQVESRTPWDPQPADLEFLRTYTTILGPVIDRLHKVHALRHANDRNRVLLHELQHRIKNNIGAITSLIQMRARQTKSKEVRHELNVISERVETLRLVHEQVYATGEGERLPLRPYVTQLLEGLLALHKEAGVHLDLLIEDMDVRGDTAIPLGLILNEFTTNSMKYAFDDPDMPAERRIAVEASRADGELRIAIRDNGKGLPADAHASRPGSGTGMALIEGLSRQLGAKPTWETGQGTALVLQFPYRT